MRVSSSLRRVEAWGREKLDVFIEEEREDDEEENDFSNENFACLEAYN